ncbi:zingipain-1-like [Tripterygium wilfordii]|uniref:zingipain-1-like n=1 Tax=Tripterygium wilfordii TaxID=458696 RepID=UPI0018F852EC|nr:zingipain-1-like [Tripterygium wilfordii]
MSSLASFNTLSVARTGYPSCLRISMRTSPWWTQKLESLEAQKVKLPPKFDWRSRGVVTPIKSQGKFATCWALAAITVLESIHAIKTNKLLVLAPQLLLDCVKSTKQFGWVDKAFQWVISSSGSAISLEKDYPYVGFPGRCRRVK